MDFVYLQLQQDWGRESGVVMLMAGLIPGKRGIYVVLIWNPNCLEERTGCGGAVWKDEVLVLLSVCFGEVIKCQAYLL